MFGRKFGLETCVQGERPADRIHQLPTNADDTAGESESAGDSITDSSTTPHRRDTF